MKSYQIALMFVPFVGLIRAWFEHRVFWRIEEKHPALYDELGRPQHLFSKLRWFPRAPGATRSVNRYIWRSEYRTLHDPIISKRAMLLKISTTLQVALLFGLAILIFRQSS